MHRTVECYGEARANKEGVLVRAFNEPVHTPASLLVSSYVPVMDELHTMIRNIGTKKQWPQSKIEQEQHDFFAKAEALLRGSVAVSQ